MDDPEILAIGEHHVNAGIIADCAKLGYITGDTLDLTYGKGSFWKLRKPEYLTTNDVDLKTKAEFHYDGRDTGWADGRFKTVVWDPPYRLAGARTEDGMDLAYGTTEYLSWRDTLSLLLDGTTEAARLSSLWVLVKTQDQVSGGKVRWMTDDLTTHAAKIGLVKIDVMMLRRWRPQPEGRVQKTARRNYSTLTIFKKKGKR